MRLELSWPDALHCSDFRLSTNINSNKKSGLSLNRTFPNIILILPIPIFYADYIRFNGQILPNYEGNKRSVIV